MPYRDVGAASQSMDSRQPKASKRSVAVHNSFPAIDGRLILAINGVVGNDETHVTSPPSRGWKGWEREGRRGDVATLFICSPPVKLGHRVTRARKRSLLGWVDPFLGPLHWWVRVHSEAERLRSTFSARGRVSPRPSVLLSSTNFRRSSAVLVHSPDCRIDHSRSSRGRPARSSRGSGTPPIA